MHVLLPAIALFFYAASTTGAETGGLTPLTPEERAYVQACRDNVDTRKRIYSPLDAKNCLAVLKEGDASFLERLKREDPQATLEIAAYGNALADLHKIINDYASKYLADALARVLEDEVHCALCDLGLGPRPEGLFGWVEQHAGKRLETVKKAARTWDILGPERTRGLSGPPGAFDKEKWNSQPLKARYKELSGWARAQARELISHAPGIMEAMGGKGRDEITRLAGLFKEDLVLDDDWSHAEDLDRLVSDLRKWKPAPLKIGVPGTTPPKDGKAAAWLEGMRGITGAGAGAGAALDTAFDGAAQRRGEEPSGPASPLLAAASGIKPHKEAPPASAAEPAKKTGAITREQEILLGQKMAALKDGKLSGYLAGEIKGTRVGDEIAGFYEKPRPSGANKLDFGFERGTGNLANANGWWCPTNRQIRLNSALVDDFARQRGITPEELLAGEQHLRDLSTYIAPTFVHEAVHQRQTAWGQENGLDFQTYSGKKYTPYQMEDEVEAFATQAAFSAERLKKEGPSYLSKITRGHARNTEVYLEHGVDALRWGKHTAYHTLHSKEGEAARELALYNKSKAYLADLEKRAPDSLSEQQKKDLRFLRGHLDENSTNARFKWYVMLDKKSAQDEARLTALRGELDPAGSALKKLKSFFASR